MPLRKLSEEETQDMKTPSLSIQPTGPIEPAVPGEQTVSSTPEGTFDPQAAREIVGTGVAETAAFVGDIGGELLGGAAGSFGGPAGTVAGQGAGSAAGAGFGRFVGEFAKSKITGEEFNLQETKRKSVKEAAIAGATFSVAKAVGKGLDLAISKARKLDEVTKLIDSTRGFFGDVLEKVDSKLAQDMTNLSKDLSKTPKQSKKAISRMYDKLLRSDTLLDTTIDMSDEINRLNKVLGVDDKLPNKVKAASDQLNRITNRASELEGVVDVKEATDAFFQMDKIPLEKAHEMKQVIHEAGNSLMTSKSPADRNLGKEILKMSDSFVNKIDGVTGGQYKEISNLWRNATSVERSAKEAFGRAEDAVVDIGERVRTKKQLAAMFKKGEDPSKLIQNAVDSQERQLKKTLTFLKESDVPALRQRADRLESELYDSFIGSLNVDDLRQGINVLDRLSNAKNLKNADLKQLLQVEDVVSSTGKSADELLAEDGIKALTEKIKKENFVGSSAFKQYLTAGLALESMGVRQNQAAKSLTAAMVLATSDLSNPLRNKAYKTYTNLSNFLAKEAPTLTKFKRAEILGLKAMFDQRLYSASEERSQKQTQATPNPLLP